MQVSTIPKFLPGCSVLPPLEPPKPRAAAPPKAKSAPRRQTRGRFAEINAFTDATLRDLDRGQIAVWLILWRDIKPNGLARTSQADLARRAGVTERTVGRSIVALRKAGLLTVVRRGTLRGGPSTYRVHPLANTPSPRPPAGAPP